MNKILNKITYVALATVLMLSAFLCGCQKGFTVTFDIDGGEVKNGVELVQEVKESSEIELPVVEKAGYTFMGWDRAVYEITETTTVKAIWVINYNVSFNLTVNYVKKQINNSFTFTLKPGYSNVVQMEYNHSFGLDLPEVAPVGDEEDVDFDYWYILSKEGEKIKIEKNTVFCDQFFIDDLGYTTEEAIAFRGETLEIGVSYIQKWTERH